ncbi:hypothetical protein [Spiroplasma endosymbiont of Atherix ibis]|uniref:hypothetical protein n=1 Tax=Spiroplasma endosymbiont of Atherix ibis TaxID=3066291 RepID=UPI0030CFB078
MKYPDFIQRKIQNLYTDITYKLFAKFIIATLKRTINIIKKIKDPSKVIIY